MMSENLSEYTTKAPIQDPWQKTWPFSSSPTLYANAMEISVEDLDNFSCGFVSYILLFALNIR